MRSILGFLVAGTIALSQPAIATSPRTFVSGFGNDANPCSIAQPCRGFATAVAKTSVGGEVTVLDSAGYGSVMITQSITITNPGGVEAAITTTRGQNAITITAPSTADITLRGLTLQGGGVGANGIFLNSGAGGSLNVIGCVVKDFAGNGIAIQPSAGTLKALIAETYALNNGASGVDIGPTSSASVRFSIAQVTAKDNGNGIDLDASASNGQVSGVVSGSHVDYNSGNGITASGKSGSFNVYVQIKNSYAIGNVGSGVFAQNIGLAVSYLSGAGIVLDNVYSLSNGIDVANTGSSIFTFQNNAYGFTSGASPTIATPR